MHTLNSILTLAFSLLAVGIGNGIHQYCYRHLKQNHKHRIHHRSWRCNMRMCFRILRHKTIRSSLLGIAWLWLVLLICASHAYSLNVHTSSLQLHFGWPLLLIMISGIFLGWWLCFDNRPKRQNIAFLPLGLLLATLSLLDLAWVSHAYSTSASSLLQRIHLLHLGLVFFALSIFGGMYLRPLHFALNQIILKHDRRYLIWINLWGAVFMVVASTLAFLIKQYTSISLHFLLLLLAISNVIVGYVVCTIIPQALVQSFIKWLLRLCFKVRIKGLKHYEQAGDRLMIIANHSSYLDILLIAAFIPDRLTFVISPELAGKWWMKPVLNMIDTVIISRTDPMATKKIIKSIKNNKPCVIFPEGRLSTTGALMKIYEGPALIADKAHALVLPLRIDGMRDSIYSKFSYARQRMLFPKISMSILPPVDFSVDPDIKGRERRAYLSQKMHKTMTTMMFQSSNINRTLFEAMLYARKSHGNRTIIMEDEKEQQVSYKTLVLKSYVLGDALRPHANDQQALGLMLPNSLAASVSFFAMQAYHITPAMINFSAGRQSIYNSCLTAQINCIITAKKFIDIVELHDLVAYLEERHIKVIYLEDIAEQITLGQKLKGFVMQYFDAFYMRKRNKDYHSTDDAAILFTSGSEGTPKGVVLSHRNIIANQYQLSTVVDFSTHDISLNFLPMFHSFGLTTGALLPVLTGMKVILYPSPLHYRIIPEIIYDRNVSMIFATNTFLTGYGKAAHAYDFYNVRFIFAGAEALKDSTLQLYNDKFGIRILQGYGATEAAPVVATNTHMQYKKGSVGRAIPALETRLEPVDGIEGAGRLFLKGPNIMKGYYKIEQPGVLQPPKDGWHDTGDIVRIDPEGYIFIQGRAKRFVKIGGEMISLLAVEAMVQECWPDSMHAVISQADPIKGEQLVLITTQQDATKKMLQRFAKKQDIPEIQVPKNIIYQKELPVLGSGKINIALIQEQFKHVPA